VFGDVSSHRLRAWLGITLHRANRGMPRSGQQDGGIGPIFDGVGQGGVPQPMQRPARVASLNNSRTGWQYAECGYRHI
jgi:hypothetical protein